MRCMHSCYSIHEALSFSLSLSLSLSLSPSLHIEMRHGSSCDKARQPMSRLQKPCGQSMASTACRMQATSGARSSGAQDMLACPAHLVRSRLRLPHGVCCSSHAEHATAAGHKLPGAVDAGAGMEDLGTRQCQAQSGMRQKTQQRGRWQPRALAPLTASRLLILVPFA